MSYVKQILFPDENVLYVGHVHPRVLFHGLVYLCAAALISFGAEGTGGGHSWLLETLYNGGRTSGLMRWLYGFFQGWQNASPDVAVEYKLLSLLVGFWGIKHFVQGILLMQTSELIVTDLRIIAKMGVLNVATLEMDRRRVAEILIDQTFWGRMLNYGHIYIRGFTGVIGGMPVMVNPHMIEAYIMGRY